MSHSQWVNYVSVDMCDMKLIVVHVVLYSETEKRQNVLFNGLSLSYLLYNNYITSSY